MLLVEQNAAMALELRPATRTSWRTAGSCSTTTRRDHQRERGHQGVLPRALPGRQPEELPRRQALPAPQALALVTDEPRPSRRDDVRAPTPAQGGSNHELESLPDRHAGPRRRAWPMATPAPAQDKTIFMPLLVYRTGPYAPNGIPIANAASDYFTLVNERDGGINGVKIIVRGVRDAVRHQAGRRVLRAPEGEGPADRQPVQHGHHVPAHPQGGRSTRSSSTRWATA